MLSRTIFDSRQVRRVCPLTFDLDMPGHANASVTCVHKEWRGPCGKTIEEYTEEMMTNAARCSCGAEHLKCTRSSFDDGSIGLKCFDLLGVHGEFRIKNADKCITRWGTHEPDPLNVECRVRYKGMKKHVSSDGVKCCATWWGLSMRSLAGSSCPTNLN